MKASFVLGIILVAIGALILAYKGITYKSKEKVVDVGPIEIEDTKTKTFPLSPVLGAVSLAGGVILIAVGRKDKGSYA